MKEWACFQPSELYTTFLGATGEVIAELGFKVKRHMGRGVQAGDEAEAEDRRGLESLWMQTGGA